MACKMLFFDYRESEEKFFKEHDLANFDIKFIKESLNNETLSRLPQEDIENAMIISVFITSTINDEIISRFKNLRVISTRSTGFDHIDLHSCASKNIALINVEAYGTTAVSQFTFALILMLVRRIYPAIVAEMSLTFNCCNYTGKDLNKMTIGIVGTGAIGSGICEMAHCSGMRILAYDLAPKNVLISKYNVQYVELDVLLKNSDIVTLHLPYTKDNYYMFSREQFEIMKQDSYFVNVSRGELVDTDALLEFAKTGKFSGIALDVVACPENENSDNDKADVSEEKLNKSSLFCIETSKTVQELSKIPNVILTPHMAYDTQEAVDYILNVTFEGLSDYVQGGRKYRVI